MSPFIRLAALAGIAILLTACAAVRPSAVRDGVPIMVYRGGVLVYDAPLDIQEQYAFRFIDKWRISHAWLSGPVELSGCTYGTNVFKRFGGYGELGLEPNGPMFEKNGIILQGDTHYKTPKLIDFSPVSREKLYGTERDGKFTGYNNFCGHFFKDSFNGLGLYIVQPDPAKGTNEWIEGAQAVTINGLHWLHKEIPIQNWSESRDKFNEPIEIWTLKIPETQYWMMLSFRSSIGGNLGMGAKAHPEKHQRLLELFHKIVESVKLEPITPINIDALIEASAERQRQKEAAEQMLTPEEKRTRLNCITKGSLWSALDPSCK